MPLILVFVNYCTKEYEGVKKKIQEGDVAGLDQIILADSSEFDDLIFEFSRIKFVKPKAVEVIRISKILK